MLAGDSRTIFGFLTVEMHVLPLEDAVRNQTANSICHKSHHIEDGNTLGYFFSIIK